jgi:hypothetical protein
MNFYLNPYLTPTITAATHAPGIEAILIGKAVLKGMV